MVVYKALKFLYPSPSNLERSDVMKTKDVIHYLEGTVCLAEIDSSYIDEAVRMIKCGENYVDMWEDLKSTHGYRTTYNSSGDQQLCRLENVMDKAEVAFLGSRPKSIRERVNDMLDSLNSVGVAVDIKELTNLLIELRDKEGNV